MRVQSSHLALRFYKHDGWTEEVLKSCISHGEIEFCPGDYLDFWRLVAYSSFDVKKLMKHITKVDRWYGEDNKGVIKETDEEYIQGMNW